MKTEHQGSCHCGAITFQVLIDPSSGVTCNCSMCERAGTILSFAPKAEFTLISGEDNLGHYRFNSNVIDHTFCNTCGIKPFGFGKDAEGNETVAVNLRCLDDVDASSIKTTEYDGKSV